MKSKNLDYIQKAYPKSCAALFMGAMLGITLGVGAMLSGPDQSRDIVLYDDHSHMLELSMPKTGLDHT